MEILLPDRKNIKETSAADPLKLYYIPIARSFYKARFADALRLLGGRVRRLLEVGCGSGIFLPELARHAESLFACDLHPNLNKTLQMLRIESVPASLVQSNASMLPYATESMDAIVCMSVLEHLHDLQSPAEEFFRVLQPGGFAIIGVPVTNLMTEVILRLSYLSFDARLEDEHVSTHRDVIRTFSQKFLMEQVLTIPRFLPETFRMYCTIRFRKPGKK
ncbi:MAG TPA: class I SAM-dependent methyltransferase [Candidatus Limnocylindrales bacterium]|nr:class I SAM-dependent methyltransferase [Candidatus Limnocylindrales bacterium]